MPKVLITADIHINDYRNHNLFNKPTFRLDQFHVLAQRFVYEIQTNPEIEALVIAGDFIHLAAPRPYVVNRAFDFLDYVSRWCPIYLTHGQHDIDTRRTGIAGNTLLSLCNMNKNVHYLHMDHTDIGGRDFYFLGWVPDTEEQIDCLAKGGGTDVFIGHFQPGTVKVGQRNFLLSGGREIPDTPPWKIAFVGDIHTHQIMGGNTVIPGVPIQHSFNDDPNPGFILFDTKSLEWERIDTIVPGTWDFLRFLITDKPITPNKWLVVRSETCTESLRMQKTFEKKLDIIAVIEEQVEHHKLLDIHRDILHAVSKEVRQDIDLNFLLEKVIIHDFRSIQHFEWDNIGEGVKLLFGNNGTGKSSLVDALMFAFSGQGSARTFTRKSSNNMYVEVTLLYGRLKHTLRRGWSTSGKLRYWINDVEQQAENQRALLERIEDNLPFLRFMDLIYHQQDRPGFLSSYNYSARVDLISRVLGLRIVQALYEEANKRLLDLDRQLATLRAKIATVNAIVEQETLVDFTFMEVIDDGKENNLKTLRDSIRSLVRDERRKYDEVNTQKTTLINRIERTTSDVSSLKERQNGLKRRTCFYCGQTVDDKQYEVLFCRNSEEIDAKSRTLESYRNELTKVDVPSTALIERLEDRLEQIIGRLSEITSMKEQQENLSQLKARIEGAKYELLNVKTTHADLLVQRETLDEYKRLLEPTGPIMRTLLLTLSEILSSDVVRVRAHKQLVSGEMRPDFTVDVCINDTWIDYDEISGGQKTVADLVILEKIVQLSGGLGLIIFDETFKFLDGENLEKIVELIKQMQCSSIFIISHVEGFPYWDASIHTSLDDNKVTKYTIR